MFWFIEKIKKQKKRKNHTDKKNHSKDSLTSINSKLIYNNQDKVIIIKNFIDK